MYDPLGNAISSTLPITLTESLAGHLDATGLQFNGGRYYDPWAGSYVQPDPFGGIPEMPQSLNGFSAASGSLSGYVSEQGGGASPLLVNVGATLGLNVMGELMAQTVEPVATRGVAHLAPSWRWLTIQRTADIAGYRRGNAHLLLRRLLQDADESGGIARKLAWGQAVRWRGPVQVGANYNVLTGLLESRGFRVNGYSTANVWEASFGLRQISPELAGHFTVGKVGTGLLLDAAIGGIWQGVSDQINYGLWTKDPWLAARRAGAGAGKSATYGGMGISSAALVGIVAVGVFEVTPPGWVLTGVALGVGAFASIYDESHDRWVHKLWFDGIDDDYVRLRVVE